MPKATFYNLNSEKKEKIEKALRHEFSQNTFEKASISNIIAEAQIPRGSFYQYFENKEDALKHIIENFLMDEKEEIKKLALKNKGDIFDITIDLYEYFVYKNYDETERRLVKNIINKLKSEHENMFNNMQLYDFQKLQPKDIKDCYINTEMLQIESEEDIEYMMRILTCLLRTEVIKVIYNKISKEKRKRRTIKADCNFKKRNDKIVQNF